MYYYYCRVVICTGVLLATLYSRVLILLVLNAPVAQRYHVTSDTLGREFDPGKRDFSH